MALLLLLASALSGTLAAQARGDSRLLVEVQQSPRYTTIPEGGSVSITCSTNGTLKGLYLKQSWPQATYVVYYEDEESRTSTVDPQFQGRVSFSGPQNNLTITMHHLQKADSGTYTCEAVQDFLDSNVPGPGTMVAVTDTLSLHRCQEPPLTSRALPAALAVGFFLMGLGLGVLCTLRRTQIKGMCTSRKKSPSSVVYEDMCYSRRNTLSTPNQYQ